MIKPQQANVTNEYDRPNLQWECGQKECGLQCALGPDRRGRCQTKALCEPRLENGKWKCARSKLQGGSCDNGPDGNGTCGCLIEDCVPKRSLRAVRGRFVFASFAITLAIVGVTLSSPWRDTVLAPGPLTQAHAQILEGKDSEKCASCHAAGDRGLGDWMLASIAHRNEPRSEQVALCVDCHKNTILPDFATNPHTHDPDSIQQLTIEAVAKTGTKMSSYLSSSQMACANCHREHHGVDHQLTYLSNEQCATCHHIKFDALAVGHPGFGDWPNGDRPAIIFDHFSHDQKHFEQKGQEFRCTMCHNLDENNEPLNVVSFEEGCASCHDSSLKISLDRPLVTLALPTIDVAALQREELSIGEWPKEYVGDFDGTIPPLMYLLLRSDPLAKSALEQFGPGFDFLDIDVANYDEMEAASELVWAIKRLACELSLDASATVQRRIGQIVGDAAVNPTIAAGIDTQRIRSLVANWFPGWRQELSGHVEWFENQSQKEQERDGFVGGEWQHDQQVAVRIKGHGNRLLAGWIETAIALGADGMKHVPELVNADGVGFCLSCHSVERRRDTGQLLVHWKSRQPDSLQRPFTKFAHGPHLLQRELEDCTSCHRYGDAGDFASAYVDPDAFMSGHNFLPMQRESCVSCHHPEGAGDSCLQCHNYHVRQ